MTEDVAILKFWEEQAGEEMRKTSMKTIFKELDCEGNTWTVTRRPQ